MYIFNLFIVLFHLLYFIIDLALVLTIISLGFDTYMIFDSTSNMSSYDCDTEACENNITVRAAW